MNYPLESQIRPPEWMYANYTDPDVIAWNWSFLPMHLLFCDPGDDCCQDQYGDRDCFRHCQNLTNGSVMSWGYAG